MRPRQGLPGSGSVVELCMPGAPRPVSGGDAHPPSAARRSSIRWALSHSGVRGSPPGTDAGAEQPHGRRAQRGPQTRTHVDWLTVQEIVPAPDRGRVFTESLRPGLADCSPTGRSPARCARAVGAGHRVRRLGRRRPGGESALGCPADAHARDPVPAVRRRVHAGDVLQRSRADVGRAPHLDSARRRGGRRGRGGVGVGPS